MVHRINENERYDYTKLKLPDAADKAGAGEKFSLNYGLPQEEETEQDQQDEHGKTEGVKKTPSRSTLQGGVRLELSQNAASAAAGTVRQSEDAQDAGAQLLHTIRSWLNTFLQSVKAFFYKLWNDPAQPETEETAAQETQAPERLSEEYLAWINPTPRQDDAQNDIPHPARAADREKEIRQYLRSGNLEQVLNIVTDNGHKTIAKNSTLLTYYDRNGRIKPLGASDQERILHGDQNVKKL